MEISGINGISEDNVSIKKPDTKKSEYMNTIFFGKPNPNEEKIKTNKELLYEKAAQLPANIRDKFLEELENSTISEDFVDMLNKRYEKKKEEFEKAWAEYQASKENLKFLQKVLEIMTRKYAQSESGYEQGLLKNAQRNYSNGNTWTDVLLSIASDIAHRII